MKFTEFIVELGHRMGVQTPAATDADPMYRIALANGTEITLESLDSGERVAVSALICRYPPDGERLALFDRLMEAHAFGLATGGAHFAASARAGKVVMAQVLDLDEEPSFDALFSELDGFVEQCQAWRAEYDSGRWSQPAASGSGAAGVAGQQLV